MSNEQQKLQHHIIRNTTPELVTLKLTNWDTKESYDIRGVFTELCLFSSIESVIASGYVTIHEQGNLISTCPIDGREFIEIKFNSTTSDNKQYEDYHRIFFVYAVDTLSEMKDTRIYTIRFTDVLGIINADMRLSIKYDMKLEDIIKNIETIIENPEMKNEEYKQILNANSTIPTGNRLFAFRDDLDLSCNTDYNMKFVVPLWKPIKLISYLTERALSHDSVSLQKDKFTDCLFFQNRKGEFVLTNYKNMFNTRLSTEYTKNVTFVKEIANNDIVSNTIANSSGIQENKYAVQKFDLDKIFNFQLQKNVGFFGFTDYITDFVNKKCDGNTITHEDIQNCINLYGLVGVTQYPYEAIKKTEEPVYFYNTCGMNTSLAEREYDKFTLPYIKGNVVRNYLEYAKIVIEMNGVSDIDIGKYVYIDLGIPEPDSKSIIKYVNETKWIVSKYSHRILGDGTFTTLVECFTPYINRNES